MVPLGLRGPKAAAEPKVRVAGYVLPSTALRLRVHQARGGLAWGEAVDEAAALLDQADKITAQAHRVKAEATASERALMEVIREQKRTIARQAAQLAGVGVRRRAKSKAALRKAPDEAQRVLCSEGCGAPVPAARLADEETACEPCTEDLMAWVRRAQVTPCAAGCGSMMDPRGLAGGDSLCPPCRLERQQRLEREAAAAPSEGASGSGLQASAPPAI